jgi:AcrR family transcriptional regulator
MKKEIKKLKVLKAASDCFARYGYDKTTLEDIGNAVGLNKASLYYYYKNKESIFCDVILQEADIFMQDMQKKVRSARSSESRITNYMIERLIFYKSIVNLHNLTMDVIRKVDPVFNDVYSLVLEKEVAFLAGLFKEGTENGEFIKMDAARTAEIILEIAISIRYKAVHMTAALMTDEVDYVKVQEDIKYSTKLILKGLKVS